MNIEGTYTLQAPSESVWQCLRDKDLLQHAIPGLERVEQVDKDTYTIALHIKHAPLLGTYTGQVTITEQMYPYFYHLAINGTEEGRYNTINGSGSIHLNERNGHTIISYKGNLTIGKRGTRLPPLVVKGAAKLLIQQFFTAMVNQLHTYNHAHIVESAEIIGSPSVIKQPAGDIVILPHTSQAPSAVQGIRSASVFHTLARLLGLGAGDPAQEERWASRLRRASIISGLLLLVWIGTRLPGRK